MLLGISGRIESGKTTVSNYLVEKYKFKKMAFADPIKEAAKAIFNWTDDHVNGPLKLMVDPFWGISPREVFQNLGTEWGRDALKEKFPLFARKTGSDIWVRNFVLRYNDYIKECNYGHVVLEDIRFLNEADAFRSLGGFILKLNRSSVEKLDHPSESTVDLVESDVVIINDFSLEDLYKAVDSTVKILSERESRAERDFDP